MAECEDRLIWHYAQTNGHTIVTQDADFELLAQLYGFPPKVIWLRCGNTATANILRWLIEHLELLQACAAETPAACLELH